MTQPYTTTIDLQTYTIREEMMAAIGRYLNDRTPPGSFLRAILENNFVGATTQSDANNFSNLPAYAHLLHWELPEITWGSKEKVDAWLAHDEQY